MPEPAYFSIGLAMKQAVTPCLRACGAHQPLQHDEVVGRLHHVLAVVERQLVLAGRIFGNHRLGRNALRLRRGVDVGKQRLHAVQMVDRIDLGLAAPAAVEHGARRLHAAFGVALVGEQEEFELEGAGRMQALFGKACDLPRQRVARVGRHRRAVEMVHRHQHLAARRLRAVQRLQRAGDRPAAQVAVAGIPDQPGLVDILAGDVEAEDRDRQMPAALIEADQLVAADDLAAADAVGVGEHDVERLDLGMGVEKRLGLVDRRTGWGLHRCCPVAGKGLVSRREFGGNIAEGRDQPVMSITPQSPASLPKAMRRSSSSHIIEVIGALAGAAQQHFLGVGEAHGHHHAVVIADRGDRPGSGGRRRR